VTASAGIASVLAILILAINYGWSAILGGWLGIN
jgi:hypothetical protein